jgi:hypothetical protein
VCPAGVSFSSFQEKKQPPHRIPFPPPLSLEKKTGRTKTRTLVFGPDPLLSFFPSTTTATPFSAESLLPPPPPPLPPNPPKNKTKTPQPRACDERHPSAGSLAPRLFLAFEWSALGISRFDSAEGFVSFFVFGGAGERASARGRNGGGGAELGGEKERPPGRARRFNVKHQASFSSIDPSSLSFPTRTFLLHHRGARPRTQKKGSRKTKSAKKGLDFSAPSFLLPLPLRK